LLLRIEGLNTTYTADIEAWKGTNISCYLFCSTSF